ncbi:hypothetical protein [Sabulicella rubraurantiaca]|uniref:hypothetical protein n=1 Tax=Sabulicella rubraurantiaca TaxID=2811429 RepID=UPI001A977F0F|nr:hypothetical protein [Sabulicella rubraurantiaca]
MDGMSVVEEGAVAAALAVLDRHMAALNAGDQAAMTAELHFPHYRLAGGRLQIWERPDTYLADFLARAGEGWHHSAWDFRNPIAASADKVHLDVQFTRYRADGSSLGAFRSIWVVAHLNGRWAAQLRSSFAR